MPLSLLCLPGLLGGCDQSKQAQAAQNAALSPAPSVAARTSADPRAGSARAASNSARLIASTTPPPGTSAAQDPADVPRVYAKTRFVWIRARPEAGEWIGYLWLGGSVRLRERSPRVGPDCRSYYAIEPRGFVCVDGKSATLDANDPVLVRLKPYAPKVDTPWPHEYGESRNTKLYDRIPSPETQRLTEADYVGQLERIERARRGDVAPLLEGVDVARANRPSFELLDIPATVHENRTRLRFLSTVAWSTEVDQDGRTWLLTHDLHWVPKDRVAPYPKVTFHGVRLGVEAKLPLAFFRGKDRVKFKQQADKLVETDARWPRLSWVELTGKRLQQEGETYLETRDQGLWVKKLDAVVPSPQATTPWGAPVGGEDKTNLAPKGRGTWIEASVLGAWLIAYEGTQPVFATMISPGRGGVPVPGKDPLETASTPTGIFNITGKFATATMEAPNEFIHSDVPWTQNFHGPHALHGAYWHDNWGHRMSAGCVNVSPIDGKYLFEFTEPAVPEGWHGVRWLPWLGPATLFVVHG